MNGEMELNFKKSVYLLFRNYPLYMHKIKVPGKRASLSILLIGRGRYMDIILDSVLTQGQLLDTKLSVTLICPKAEDAKTKFLERAPYAEHFLTIHADNEPYEKNNVDKYAEIHFVSCNPQKTLLEKIKKDYRFQSYIIVAHDEPSETDRVVNVCKSASMNLRRIIAYKKDGYSDEFEVYKCSTQASYLKAETNEKIDVSKELDRIAFNLHYSYAKQRNDHEPINSIKKSYDDYSKLSSLCSAEHLLSKLSCCDINTTDYKRAAQEFQQKITNNSQLFDKLTDLEHRRWVIEKILQGYRKPDEAELESGIFENENTTHVESENDKWHCCLVDSKPGSQIKKEHWEMSPGELKKSGLDELDQMSVRIHQICKDKAEKNREIINNIFKNNLVKESWRRDIKKQFSKLELSISQIYQTKKSAIAIYKKQLKQIETILGDNKIYTDTLGKLEQIDVALAPQIEFISYIDYKESDRQFIRAMPYVLTHDSNATIIKVVSDKSTSNIYSAWKIEPEKMVYIGFAKTNSEFNKLQRQYGIMKSCVDNILTAEKSIWKVFVSESVWNSYVKELDDFFTGNGSVENAGKNYKKKLYNRIEELVDELEGSCYLDITGADFMIAQECMNIAKKLNIGIFYIDKDSQLINIYNCEELDYSILKKSYTVEEMFEWSGAVQKIDGFTNEISDISKLYKDLWGRARDNGSQKWTQFCNVKKQLRSEKSENGKVVFAMSRYYKQEKNNGTVKFIDQMPIIKELEECGIIKILNPDEANKNDVDCNVIIECDSTTVHSILTMAGMALEEYIYYTALLDGEFSDIVTGWKYFHSASENAADNELDVVCTKGSTSIFISAKFVNSMDSKKLNPIIYEIKNQAEMFGMDAKSVIAMPCVRMFDDKEIGNLVKHSYARGVYLLGDKCFEGDNLIKVLNKIADGDDEWYQFMLE